MDHNTKSLDMRWLTVSAWEVLWRPAPPCTFGPFALDGTDDGLWCGPERRHLTAKAEAVLRYLVAHPDRLVHKADLLAAVWPNVHVSDWALTTCIREIRHVLGDVARTPQYIATVHRQGYRFIAPVTVVATPLPLLSRRSPRSLRTLPHSHARPPSLHPRLPPWRRNTSW